MKLMQLLHKWHYRATRVTSIDSVALMSDCPPWPAVLRVNWNTVESGLSRKQRSRTISSLLKELDLSLGKDYQTRYDEVMDRTIVYFENKENAVTAYFYLS